ncbi:unnamed protein product, partial [Citrullus colocynthis]
MDSIQNVAMNSGGSASPSTIKKDRKGKRKRGSTWMKEITCVHSERSRRMVEYNEHGQPTGENETKLKSFIETT